jgi:hypothetical protein
MTRTKLNSVTKDEIVATLKDPVQNIFLAAKHLAHLGGPRPWTTEKARRVGASYNGTGRNAQGYGDLIISYRKMLERLITERRTPVPPAQQRAGAKRVASQWETLAYTGFNLLALGASVLCYVGQVYDYGWAPGVPDRVDPDAVIVVLASLALFFATVGVIVLRRFTFAWLIYLSLVIIAGCRLIDVMPLYQG